MVGSQSNYYRILNYYCITVPKCTGLKSRLQINITFPWSGWFNDNNPNEISTVSILAGCAKTTICSEQCNCLSWKLSRTFDGCWRWPCQASQLSQAVSVLYFVLAAVASRSFWCVIAAAAVVIRVNHHHSTTCGVRHRELKNTSHWTFHHIR